MFVDALKAAIHHAVKVRDDVARDVLRLAFGEIQTAEARSSRSLSDEEATAIVKKLVKSNEETLALASSGERADVLRREIAVLSALLPKTMTVEQLVEALGSQTEAIRAAKNDGQATGVAMKHLKSVGGVFEGKDVGEAVRKIRA
ncbi:MAG: GatB/YqeY domain-containing protein [Deltaproteobacteria bacterium]|nr:GatB/YqeY domain-containing protein [Deltaproteobacteria bacterium]